jgi:hypothetical protein
MLAELLGVCLLVGPCRTRRKTPARAYPTRLLLRRCRSRKRASHNWYLGFNLAFILAAHLAAQVLKRFLGLENKRVRVVPYFDFFFFLLVGFGELSASFTLCRCLPSTFIRERRLSLPFCSLPVPRSLARYVERCRLRRYRTLPLSCGHPLGAGGMP